MKKINKTRIAIALPLLAIVVAAGFAMVTGDKVFAQPAVQNSASSQTVDQPDSQNSQSTNADNQSDGETNDNNSASSQDSTGDGDGEHQD